MAKLGRLILRFFVGITFAIAILILKGQSQHLSRTTHHNPPHDLPQLDIPSYNGSDSQHGWTSNLITNLHPLGLIDTFLPKKWDAFVFLTYNYYMAEIVLADLGFVSQVTISLTHLKQKHQIVAEYFAPFKLQQFFKGDIAFKTSSLEFQLLRQSTSTSHTTTINFKALHGNKTIVGNLKQTIPTQTCLTVIRPYSSIKCLTGLSDGSILIQYKIINKQYKYQQEISDSWKFNNKVATVLYDGFRGAGYNWYWVWAFGIGWNYNIEQGAVIESPIKSAGISIGFMLREEENFIVIEGQAIKLKTVEYELKDGLNQSKLVFTSEKPKGMFNFEIKQKYVYDDNKVVVHKHIEKAYGMWDGVVRFENGTVFKFEKLFGFVEICKSRF